VRRLRRLCTERDLDDRIGGAEKYPLPAFASWSNYSTTGAREGGIHPGVAGRAPPFGIDEALLYPLFTPEVVDVMRRTIPPDHQDHVATGVIVKARKPGESFGA
jgi:hypothetical protein